MASCRSSRYGARRVLLAAVVLTLMPGLPSAAHAAVSGVQSEALSVDLGGAERNPSDDSNGRVDLGGSDRNDSSGDRPAPPADPQPEPPVPAAPQPAVPAPVFTAQPERPEGNGGSAEAVPSVDGDGWLPTEAPSPASAVEASPGPVAPTPANGARAHNPIGEATHVDDPTASDSSSAASTTPPFLRWGGALAAAVVAGLAVLGFTLLRARRRAE